MTRRNKTWPPPSPDHWAEIVASHVGLWCDAAERVRELPRDSWDHLLCWLGAEGGDVVIFATKAHAPFEVPQNPNERIRRYHFEEIDLGCDISVPAFDTYGREGWSDEDLEAADAQVTELRVRAIRESLGDPRVENALLEVGEPDSFGIHWAPQSDSGYFVLCRHLRGQELPSHVPPTTAYAALALLFWHSHSFVGRNHVGMAFEGDELVEATLSGPDVTDETLELLDAAGAACCGGLRRITLSGTRTSEVAVERLRGMLPDTKVISVSDPRA